VCALYFSPLKCSASGNGLAMLNPILPQILQ